MARKSITTRGNSIVGIYPEDFERGHVPGRRGIRRVLCQKSEVAHLSDEEKATYLNDLYYSTEHQIRKEQLDEAFNKEKRKKSKKASDFSEVSKKWLTEVKSTKSSKTWKAYKNTIDLYTTLVKNHRMSEFDREKNMDFFTQLQGVTSHISGKPITSATQNMHMRQLQNFLNWAYDNEYIEKQFNLKKAKIPQKEMETFSMDQVDTLAEFLEQQSLQDAGKRNPMRYKNLWLAYFMARHTLLRIGHIWSLKLENIDLDRGFIRITANDELGWHPKGLKWPNKPINKTLKKFLKEDLESRPPEHRYYLDNGKGQPWVKEVSVISKNMRMVCDELELPQSVKPFHWGIRATFITWLLNEGVPPVQVQHLADHSDLATTMRYFNTRVSNQRSAADLLG